MVTRGHRRYRAARARVWRDRRSGPDREAGYNLVVLMVMITVLNIVVAKALPLWSTVIQREKEAELIFRGLQYAEAIRVFEARHGRPPNRLEELVEVEPRAIRQLWPNPMTEDGSWLLIPAGTGRQVGGPQNQQGRDRGRDRNRNQNRDDGRDSLPGDPSKPDQSRIWVPGGEKRIGSFPISGVASPEGGDAIKIFNPNPNAPGGGDGGGGGKITDWRFTADLAKILVRAIDPQNPIAPSMNAADLGKPWPPGIQPQNLPTPQQGGHRGGGTHAIQKPGQPNKPGGGG